jgi:hypothetical protein
LFLRARNFVRRQTVSLFSQAQVGPILPSGWSNKFASQIRKVQCIRFRVIWRLTEFVGKSLIFNEAQSN